MVENGQASTSGLGWSDVSPGYITRSFAACSKDGLPNKGDQCWKTDSVGLVDEFSLVLNGQASPLVRVPDSANEFRLRDDAGWKIIRTTDGASSSSSKGSVGRDNNGERFTVTTPDGTKYFFGLSPAASESVWTVPVYGNDAGEPCYDATAADGWCHQAWRWNLDRSVDASENKVNYFYNPETNHYSRWANASEGFRTEYTRGGLLQRVEYGHDRESGQARQIVKVTAGRRCTLQMGGALAGSCSGDNSPQSAPNKWPDVPTDLMCGATGSCLVGSPSFFNTTMVATVETFTVSGNDGARVERPVNRYVLEYALSDPDGAANPDTPDLWLDRVRRIGLAGQGELAVPAVTFDGVALANRVDPGSGREFKKFRVSSIRNETGGRIDVVYGHASGMACTPAYVDGRARFASEKECWAQRWTPPSGGDSRWEWFHKYVVTRLGLGDDALGYRLGQAPSQATKLGSLRVYDYEYVGTPAWRFTGSRNTDTADETWADWRGYEVTKIHTRAVEGQAIAAGDVALRRVTRFRGMNGTRKNTSGDQYGSEANPVRIDTMQYGAAEDPVDERGLAGKTAEVATQEVNGTLIERTTTDWGAIKTVDSGGRQAHIRYPRASVRTVSLRNASGAPNDTRTIETRYRVYNVPGQPLNQLNGVIVAEHQLGGPANDNDDRCVDTDWIADPDSWIRVQARVRTYGDACKPNGVGVPGNLLRDVSMVYDGPAYGGDASNVRTQGQAGGHPDIPRGLVRQVVTSTGNGQIVTRTNHDQFGRVGATWDGKNTRTDITYNPGRRDNDLLTEVKVETVINSGGTATTMTSRSELHPATGLPTKFTDANGVVTDVTYNQLGQPTVVDEAVAGGAHVEYDYYLRNDAPSAVISRTASNGGDIKVPAKTFYDGWGRQIEVQTPQPGDQDKRIVAATGYDEQGLVRYSMPAIPNGSPIGDLLNAAPSAVARYTGTLHDAAGRPVEVTERSFNTDVARHRTYYRGDMTISDPPRGGQTLTKFDHFGQMTRVERYAAAAEGVGTTLLDAASYAYNGVGEMVEMTKNVNGATARWQWGFDRVGRQVWAFDPDTKATITTYDTNNNPVTVTRGSGFVPPASPWNASISNPLQHTVTTYDDLNRPLIVSAAPTPTSPLTMLASYRYDGPSSTFMKGRLASVTQPLLNIQAPPGVSTAGTAGQVTTSYTYTSDGSPATVTDTYPAWLTGEYTHSATTSTANSNAAATVSKTTSYDYNRAGAPTRVRFPTEPRLPSLTLTYNYRDRTGALDTIGATAGPPPIPPASPNTTVPTEATPAAYTYNSIGQVTGIYSSGWNGKALDRRYTYWEDTGRLGSIVGYAGQPTEANRPVLHYAAYWYDTVGNISATKVVGRAQTTSLATDTSVTYGVGAYCYSYDALNRLKTAKVGDAPTPDKPTCAGVPDDDGLKITGARYNLTYNYADARLTSITSNIGSSTAQYGYNSNTDTTGPHQTVSITATGSGVGVPAPTSLTYDALGRVTRSAPPGAGPTVGVAYEYGLNGRTSIMTEGATTIRRAYRADGTLLVKQDLNTSNGVTSVLANVLYRSDGTELTCATTCLTPTDPAASKATANRPLTDPVTGSTIATFTNEAAYTNPGYGWAWQLADNQGSNRVTRHANGTHSRTTYTPFGAPTITGTQPTPAATGRNFLNKPTDTLGNVDLDHRQYTANLSIFTTPDPILVPGDLQSANPYAYSHNNPIALSDPSGLAPRCGAEMPCSGAAPASQSGAGDAGDATEADHGGFEIPPFVQRLADIARAEATASEIQIFGAPQYGPGAVEAVVSAGPYVYSSIVILVGDKYVPISTGTGGDTLKQFLLVLDVATSMFGLAGLAKGALTQAGKRLAAATAREVARKSDSFLDNWILEAAKTVDDLPTVNWGQQSKHFPGHQNFIPGRSTLTANPEALIQRAGTGTPVGSVPRGQAGFKERIDFGDSIGTYVSRDGTSSPTSIGILHYRADGSVHIIPGRPQ